MLQIFRLKQLIRNHRHLYEILSLRRKQSIFDLNFSASLKMSTALTLYVVVSIVVKALCYKPERRGFETQ
jgi:hypothetical protein